MRILATKYYARGRKNFPAKKLSIWFLAGKFFPTFSSYSFPPLTFPPAPLLATTTPTSREVGVVVATRCLCCCQWILEPSGLELLNLGMGRRLNHLILLSFNFGTWLLFMRSRNFSRKFSNSSGRSRTAEPWIAGPSSYPLDHEVLVERIISELPDELCGREILQNYVVEES